ncbi:hypothetical protein D3C72_1311360 [compost metagenome]
MHHGLHAAVVRVQRRLAIWRRHAGQHLQFGQVTALEAFNQHPVQVAVQLRDQRMHIGLLRLGQFAHQHHALVGRRQYLVSPCLSMAPGVLAGGVDVKTVVRMLDDRHTLPVGNQHRNHLLDQSGFAAARIARKTDHLHINSSFYTYWRSCIKRQLPFSLIPCRSRQSVPSPFPHRPPSPPRAWAGLQCH